MMVEVGQSLESPKESWWRRRLMAPVVAQLTQGISPDKIAWTISLGCVLGVFPILGSTTLVCFIAGWLLRLNQPLLFVAKTLVYPLHLALILVFIRLGERFHGVPLIRFSIPELLEKFNHDPLQFAKDFGMAAWHGVSAWMVIAPFAALIIKISIAPALRALAVSIGKLREVQP